LCCHNDKTQNFKPMKPIKIIFLVASIVFVMLSSCVKEPLWGINGKGSNTVETVNYQGFSKIDLGFDADVLYTQDSIYKIEISAQSNIQRVMEVEVSKGILVFRANKRILRHNPIQIIIHSPDIKGFFVSGSGYVYAQNPIHTTSMDLNVSGSGGISIPALETDNIYAEISGSGKVKIDGVSKSQHLNITSSGCIDALNVKSDNCNVDVSGAGDVKLWVTEKLDVLISGSGKVSYKGSPAITTKITGSGKIIKL
jgi:phage-related protein